MQRATSPGFRLHLRYADCHAKKVLFAGGAPRINVFGHGTAWGYWVYHCKVRKEICHACASGTAVYGYFFHIASKIDN
jgi:hypothetical protein